MELSREDVEKVALLARLQFSAEELAKMTVELRQIVSYVDQLAELDADTVEPMAHAVELFNVLADDKVEASFEREQMLAGAPRRDDVGGHTPGFDPVARQSTSSHAADAKRFDCWSAKSGRCRPTRP